MFSFNIVTIQHFLTKQIIFLIISRHKKQDKPLLLVNVVQEKVLFPHHFTNWLNSLSKYLLRVLTCGVTRQRSLARSAPISTH